MRSPRPVPSRGRDRGRRAEDPAQRPMPQDRRRSVRRRDALDACRRRRSRGRPAGTRAATALARRRRFELAHQRDHAPAEILDLLLEVQEAEQDQVGAGLLEATMRSAICSGVPIRFERKPSLYWTRSSKFDFAQLPSPSGEALPAFFTSWPKPLHRLGIGLGDDLAQDLPRLRLGLAGDDEGVDADPDAVAVRQPPWRGCRRPACAIPSGVLPLVKYQSETRAAMSRAARELPPWKISGSGSIGFGFR